MYVIREREKQRKTPRRKKKKKTSPNKPNIIKFHKNLENHRRTDSDPIPPNQEEL